jgi:hypothetical protein
MGESYVRPVTGASEPLPRWVAVWRFRVLALVMLAVLAFVTVEVIQRVQGAERQDPGVSETDSGGTDPGVLPGEEPAPVVSPS